MSDDVDGGDVVALNAIERGALQSVLNSLPGVSVHIVPGGRFESVVEIIIASRLDAVRQKAADKRAERIAQALLDSQNLHRSDREHAARIARETP